MKITSAVSLTTMVLSGLLAASPKTWSQQNAWFLLMAPLSKDGKTQDQGRPLGEWAHIASFDTAEGCERYRNQMTSRGTKEKELYPVEEWGEARVAQIYSGMKCLPLEIIKEWANTKGSK